MIFKSLAILVSLSQLVVGLHLRVKEAPLDAFTTASPDAAYTYHASNENTRPPKAFSDPIVPDMAYHEAVPALYVLQQLTTTAAPRQGLAR